jgi:Kef-type K+ transport system membrane component KefB
MALPHELNFTLPLQNPVLIFALILFIILFAPLILNKFKIPHLIGLIIAGAIIGPNGLNLMPRDSSIILFGTVGLLYIMFLAGLEIDLAVFKKNSKKSLVFGLYTFAIPMILGLLSGVYILGFSMMTSVLLASMFASHTLIAYPLLSKMGVTKNRAVTVAVGGTIITDTMALLVLAVVAGMATGEINNEFWIRLCVSVTVFSAVVVFLFPVIGRWFFKRFDDSISQYIFVLGLVFLGAFLAQAAGIEAIIGAFLAGLSLNRLIPQTSPLMNRIEFVGNALFIPFFLIGVGMLIDYRAFVKSWDTLQVAFVMTVVATVAKFLAAWVTQKTFSFTVDERRLIFGLSNAQAAATLAAVLVGYNIVLGYAADGSPIRLLNESVLNGTLLMILVTCTMASFVAQKGAQNIALAEELSQVETDEDPNSEKVLISVSNIETVDELVNLGITVKSKRKKRGVYALTVLDSHVQDPNADRQAKKILEKSVVAASATDTVLQPLLRYDSSVVNGISNVVMEHKITDLILGLHAAQGLTPSFLNQLLEGLLSRCNVTTLIYRSKQPLSTIKRHLVVLPAHAEREIGFPSCLMRIWNMARNTGGKIVFYSTEETLNVVRDLHAQHPIDAEFHEFDDWHDFLILSRDIRLDDNLMVMLSRKDKPSYHPQMAKVPTYLNKYFKANNFILIYPMQVATAGRGSLDLRKLTIDPIKENLERFDEIGKNVMGLFRKK